MRPAAWIIFLSFLLFGFVHGGVSRLQNKFACLFVEGGCILIDSDAFAKSELTFTL